MLHVLGCITEQHDLRLVAVAAFLCALASWTSLTLLWRARVNEMHFRSLWILAAAVVFGAGVWATHFVAMLAYHGGLPIGYDVGWTSLSVAIAIAVSDAGFLLVFRPGWAFTGGGIVGFGISAMHYVGMRAVEGPFHIRWDARYVIASVLLGIGFGVLAALSGTRIRNIRGRILAAICFVLGICAMHFTAMSAATLVPDPSVIYDDSAVVAPGTLAIAIALAALLIVMLGLVSGQLDRHLELRRTGEAARLRTYVAELEATRSDLRLALHSAHAASEAKSVFLAAMSHELRTPLNAIIGFSDFILSKPSNAPFTPRHHEYIEEIYKSGLHLLTLINNILDLSGLDANSLELQEDIVSLASVLKSALASVEPDARKAGVRLDMRFGDLPCVRADERRLKQIVLNLLSNAVKFTPKGGSVRLQALASSGGIFIEVSDTGIGIAEEHMKKAMERFGQIDSRLARRYEGTGLGLPLARQLTELHGGTLSLKSEPDHGTVARVMLPARCIVSFEAAA